jgi:hypothetical protein
VATRFLTAAVWSRLSFVESCACIAFKGLSDAMNKTINKNFFNIFQKLIGILFQDIPKSLIN